MKTFDFEALSAYGKTMGLDAIGCMSVKDLDGFIPYYEQKEKKGYLCHLEQQYPLDDRLIVDRYLKGGQTFLAVLFPFQVYETDNIPEKGIYLSVQGRSLDYHTQVKAQLEVLKAYLKSAHDLECRVLCDTHPFPERYIASQAGLGIIGKNTYLIHEVYGAATMIGLLLVDGVPDLYESKDIEDLCRDCYICIKACPNKAIMANRHINSNKCLSYLTQKKDLEDHEMSVLNNNLYGCDVCAVVCPYTQKGHIEPKDMGSTVDRMALLSISNRDFKDQYLPYSLGWIGKKRLQRNAILSLRYDVTHKALLESLTEDPREEIQKAAYNALKNLENTDEHLG